jgi:anti-sigma B factor antagonist
MDLVQRVDDHDGWAVVVVHGDLDLTTAPRLRDAVVRVLTAGDTRAVLDLGGVPFIDSTGLGVLVGLLKRARSLGGDLRIVSQSSSLRDVLELTALERSLPPFPDVPAATGDVRTAGG